VGQQCKPTPNLNAGKCIFRCASEAGGGNVASPPYEPGSKVSQAHVPGCIAFGMMGSGTSYRTE